MLNNKIKLNLLAKQIARQNNFKINKLIHTGFYYKKENIRNLIFSGKYKNQPAVLKVYNDSRISLEATAHKYFLTKNKSQIILAPKIYKHKILSSHTGWIIEQQIPKSAKQLKSPLDQIDRQKFTELYFEYRKNFSNKPNRQLNLVENLPADKFHLFRLSRWFELATASEIDRQIKNQKTILNFSEFLKYYLIGIKIIEKEFKNQPMIWCHGHFRPKALFQDRDKYYLFDFSQSKMYPQGYELAFIIWADYLMPSNYSQHYSIWKKPIFEWVKIFEPVAKKLKIKNYNKLIRASLIERILGTILADVCAGELPDLEKRKRIKHLYQLFDEVK